MGIFDWLLGAKKPNADYETVALVLLGHTEDRGKRPYGVDVVGESNYQDALWRAVGERSPKGARRHYVTAVLRPEPDNKYDPNAIAVHAVTPTGALKVGYLSRRLAEEYHADFVALRARGYETGACDAVIIGGFRDEEGDVASLGIRLNLGRPGSILPPPDEASDA